MHKITTALIIFYIIACLNIQAQTTTLRFSSLITGRGETITDAVVVIENNKIVKVASGKKQIPKNTNLIDLRPLTAIPGLIDAHTHITYYWDQSPGTKPWAQLGDLGAAVTVYLAQENARKALETGVTTIRDLGSFDNMDFAMRDLINREAMVGPRMFIAGRGISNRRTKGVEAVKAFAQEQIDAGADWIKMYGSTGSANDLSGKQTFNFEEMSAAVEVAHLAGKRISIHSYGPDGARDAVRAGTNTVEHATDMDDVTIQEMARKGIIYVPTVDHNRYYAAHKDEYGYDDTDVNNLNDYIQQNLATLKKAVKAKVKIAMGSDAVFTGFGENTRELEWFVKAGMTPAEALETATTIGAEMLGKENELGAIAPGFLADIVAVEGDPLKDINVVIKKVRWVMKNGKVVIDKRKGTTKNK
jgi:imidazolonepropionase-like amidohydrolase